MSKEDSFSHYFLHYLVMKVLFHLGNNLRRMFPMRLSPSLEAFQDWIYSRETVT